MNKQKEFDCIQMKTEIQQQLQLEITEFGEEEASKRREQRLLDDPVLGPFLQARSLDKKPKLSEHTPAA